MSKHITFYAIRSIKEFAGYGGGDCPYAFKKGWYASREFVKPFDKAKIFTSKGKASRFLKKSSTLGGPDIKRDEYFEIVPIQISEPP